MSDLSDTCQALDSLRFCIEPDARDASGRAVSDVCVEAGIADEVVAGLRARGHSVRVVQGHERAMFGRGQIIQQLPSGVLAAGGDPRADGCPVGW